MTRTVRAARVGLAGITVVGVTFGFARYGYGLLLPDIRRQFQLTDAQAGLLGSSSYIGYLIALLLVGGLSQRLGPRTLVVIAGAAAAVGTAMIGLAGNAVILTVGLLIAGTGPAWSWAPFSDVADRLVAAERRERVLALIPSGTAFGVAVAGPVALVTAGSTWRSAWLVFSALALAATWYNARVLAPVRGPAPAAGHDSGTARRSGWWRGLRGVPGGTGALTALFGTAWSYGLVGSVYWSFAVSLVTRSGGDGVAVTAVFWTVLGLAGTLGVFTGPVLRRLGLRRTRVLLFLLMATAIGLLGAFPGTLPVAALSAVLFGPAFMAGSGFLAVWNHRLFPDRPSAGFGVTLFVLGIGTVLGPALVGVIADASSLRVGFGLVAGIAAVTGLLGRYQLGAAVGRTLPYAGRRSIRSGRATDRGRPQPRTEHQEYSR